MSSKIDHFAAFLMGGRHKESESMFSSERRTHTCGRIGAVFDAFVEQTGLAHGLANRWFHER